MTPQARLRTSPENVSDVLDAVVRAIRAQRTIAGALVRHELALHDLIETRREAQEKPCG